MKFSALALLISVLLFSGCATEQRQKPEAVKEPPKKARPIALNTGKIFSKDDKKFLFGGKDSTWHFDITNSFLIDSQYHYGIGREVFDALITPAYISVNKADSIYPDSARFLLVNINDDVKAFGIDLLTHHEIVNDIVGGQPVMAAYCVLADLGAIYDRTIDDKVYTFALSGYTYYDPNVWDGMDGFVFWDRETESTWWPLIGKAVSGSMINTPLGVHDKKNWSQTDWLFIKENYPQAKVLKPGQTMEPPKSWPKYENTETSSQKGIEIPPKWGDNKELSNS